MNLFYQPQLPQGVLHLDEDESRHVVKVLRKKQGDHINLTDGQGNFYSVTIARPDSRQCTFTIDKKTEERPKNFTIHIAIAATKNSDRLEWFVEKSVELGINEITLLKCDHSERQHFKMDRLRKTAISAMKQSLKASLPIIYPVTDFEILVRSTQALGKYIAHV
ncbi:MAG TPA: RsmE family RNA methyltransferase, partial [Chryseolinea sp.]